MAPFTAMLPSQAPMPSRRLGPEQYEALRRLATGHWLLRLDRGHVYWCTEHGARVPPHHSVRRALFDSLAQRGLLRAAIVRTGQRHYTVSRAGLAALRGQQPERAEQQVSDARQPVSAR